MIQTNFDSIFQVYVKKFVIFYFNGHMNSKNGAQHHATVMTDFALELNFDREKVFTYQKYQNLALKIHLTNTLDFE